MRHFAAALALLGCLTASAMAQQPPTYAPAREVDCGEAGSNVEIGQCLVRELRSADAALDQLVRRRLADVDKEGGVPAAQRPQWRQFIRQAQESFLAYRQNECGILAYEWWGGSGASNAQGFCRLELTRERIRRVTPEHH
jgi:uncharacterized protein YecT (DUF1311 family)